MIEVIEDRKEWNNSVQNSEIQYFTYLYEWMEVFKDCYGYEMYPLGYREKNGELTSVFPLMFDKEKKNLLSPPFGGWGGATKVEHYPDYLDYIDKLGKELKARKIRVYPAPIPSLKDVFSQKGYNIKSTSAYLTLNVKNLGFAEIKKNYKKNIRRIVNKAVKENLVIKIEKAEDDNIRLFYSFYKYIMKKNKASNVFPSNLFFTIANKMKTIVEIRMVRLEDKTIAASFDFNYGGRIVNWFVGCYDEYRKLSPNTLIYSNIIETAVEKNCAFADLGPSGWDDSNFWFKLRFGASVETHINAIKGLNIYDKGCIGLTSWGKKQLREHEKLSEFAYRVHKKIK